MREIADQSRIQAFMEALARGADRESRVYLVGGATAVLMGWRDATIDVDIALSADSTELLKAIGPIKEQLNVNVELASPADFLPIPAGWEERSPFVKRLGRVSYFHFDLYAQALAKIERGHRQDLEDVRFMLERGIVARANLLDYFERLEGELYRFPAIDPGSFRRAVEVVVSR